MVMSHTDMTTVRAHLIASHSLSLIKLTRDSTLRKRGNSYKPPQHWYVIQNHTFFVIE